MKRLSQHRFIFANVLFCSVMLTETMFLEAHSHATPSASVSSSVSAPQAPVSVSSADVDRAFAQLLETDASVRQQAVKTIAMAPSDWIAALEEKILHQLAVGTGPLWLAFNKLKKPNGKPTTDLDYLAGAVLANPSAANRAIALIFATLQLCDKQQGLASSRLLVRLGVEHKGMFKPMIVPILKKQGDWAVAALVEQRRAQDKEMKNWANKTLDTLGKFLPSDAVQVRDTQALADILTAFGKSKDSDSLRAIVPYLNADRTQVREAARHAVTQFGAEARTVLKETLESFTGTKVSDSTTADAILKQLLGSYDRVRLAEVFKLYEDGVRARDAGKLDDALSQFDALLARAPTFEKRAELAPTYFESGKRTISKDELRGRALMSKALRLAHMTPYAALVEAELAYLDAETLYKQGVFDRALVERAIRLDPSHQRARDLLTRMNNDATSTQSQLKKWIISLGGAVLAGLLVIVLLTRRSAKTPPRLATSK